jgi:hypothetical protein
MGIGAPELLILIPSLLVLVMVAIVFLIGRRNRPERGD